MALNGRFGLICNRVDNSRVCRFSDSSETEEDILLRDQRLQEKNKTNRRLNNLSKGVRRELNEREWASVYLEHLAGRVNEDAEVRIEFHNMPDTGSLSVDDNRDLYASGDAEELHEQKSRATTDLQLSILQQRRRDAKIGQERAWRTLECLAHKLALGIWLFYNLFSLG